MLDSSEAILIEYDPQQLSYSEILDMWCTKFAHFRSKPSKRQYRHVLFCQSDDGEREVAVAKVRALERTSPVYVNVEEPLIFYRAEEHHQDFFLKSRAKIEASNRLRMTLRMF
mmetsp:Transcript_11044/g.18322  ORF Transcript_11044/g.18322 Transcript_11044/m.18322 type:complete len:113 (-) Transcript_11044:160-498(-)|eukprot:CAMPEP_0119004746 /NCGR_PEP_ID=MMETSP1176-20130426/1331_1 /TAXON_ID=265551 /ORGANISM="Synedropsis recta cf, Strain CCMP1620" /LENGTH=112 /DNA_ID=CAMNT_0006956491 /DNA_START=314 /DNA_END=652 /DNA_ORIENTATION=+